MPPAEPVYLDLGVALPVIAVLAGVLGAMLGSFLNVCVYRLPRNESIVRPRSRCPACGQPIAWYDNVPLLSWLALRARCRHCGAPISIQYPLVELAVALIWAGSVAWRGPTAAAASAATLATLLLGIAMTDVRHYIIPDLFSVGGLAAGLLLAALPGGLPLWQAAAGAAFGYALLWLVRWVGDFALRRGLIGGKELDTVLEEDEERTTMGEGDLRMLAMIGSFLGLSGVLLTVFLGALLGSLVFLPLRVVGKQLAVPFGIFLGVGALTALVVGPGLVAWYGAAVMGR